MNENFDCADKTAQLPTSVEDEGMSSDQTAVVAGVPVAVVSGYRSTLNI